VKFPDEWMDFPDKGKNKDIGIYPSAGCQVLLIADWAKEFCLQRLSPNCFKTGRHSCFADDPDSS
jgi:hypothetical protein